MERPSHPRSCKTTKIAEPKLTTKTRPKKSAGPVKRKAPLPSIGPDGKKRRARGALEVEASNGEPVVDPPASQAAAQIDDPQEIPVPSDSDVSRGANEVSQAISHVIADEPTVSQRRKPYCPRYRDPKQDKHLPIHERSVHNVLLDNYREGQLVVSRSVLDIVEANSTSPPFPKRKRPLQEVVLENYRAAYRENYSHLIQLARRADELPPSTTSAQTHADETWAPLPSSPSAPTLAPEVPIPDAQAPNPSAQTVVKEEIVEKEIDKIESPAVQSPALIRKEPAPVLSPQKTVKEEPVEVELIIKQEPRDPTPKRPSIVKRLPEAKTLILPTGCTTNYETWTDENCQEFILKFVEKDDLEQIGIIKRLSIDSSALEAITETEDWKGLDIKYKVFCKIRSQFNKVVNVQHGF